MSLRMFIHRVIKILASCIAGILKATTPCPVHNLPIPLIYLNSCLLIAYCIGKVYILGNLVMAYLICIH